MKRRTLHRWDKAEEKEEKKKEEEDGHFLYPLLLPQPYSWDFTPI